MRRLWFIKVILFGAVAAAAFSYVVMLLWNALIPDLFHGPVLSWLQALGLLVLSKILFKGFGWRGGHWRSQWRERMTEKMNAMTPEEREKFREQWRHRCGKWGHWQSPSTGAGESSST